VHDRGDLGAGVPLQRLRERGEARGVLDRPPHGKRQAPIGNQDPAHLAQRGGPVGEELQALLAEDDLERAVGEGQVGGVAGPPVDRRADLRRGRPRHLEHALVAVQAGDGAAGLHQRGGAARHDAGAAGHVEHPLARSRRRQLDQLRGPRREQGRHQVALVVLGEAAGKLPSLPRWRLPGPRVLRAGLVGSHDVLLDSMLRNPPVAWACLF
jgi:hypothetical protein